jgi:DNA-binding beta-propeller fold protein YncE
MLRHFAAVIALLAPAWPALGAGNPHIVAVDSSRALSEINIATGAKTPIGMVSANAGTTGGLAVGLNNIVWVTSTSNDSLYTLDLATGTATLVGAYGDAAIVMHGLEYVEATDTLYGLSSHNNGLYNINKTTGAATLVGTSSLTSFTNLGWNSVTSVMYATNSGTDSLYTINLATGAATLVGALGGPTNPNGLAFHPDLGILFMVDNNTDTFYTINMATGAATAIGSTGAGNLLGLAYLNGAIPVELVGFSVD